MKKTNITGRSIYRKRRQFRFFASLNEQSDKKIDEQTSIFSSTILRFKKAHEDVSNQDFDLALGFIDNNFYLSYDEKILFLVRLFDPTLKMLYIYNKFASQNGIKIDVRPKIIAGKLVSISEELEENISAECEKELGFYDPLLLCYEYIYKDRILTKTPKSNETGLRSDYIRQFKNVFDFRNISLDISDDELIEIIGCADEYLKAYPKPNLNDLMFQFLCESANMDANEFRKKLIFLIFVLDKDLRYLQVYDSNYHLVRIKKIIASMFGAYSQFLMDLELKFIEDNKSEYTSPIKKPNYR